MEAYTMLNTLNYSQLTWVLRSLELVLAVEFAMTPLSLQQMSPS